LAAVVVFGIWLFEHLFDSLWGTKEEEIPRLFGVIPQRFMFDAADIAVILGFSVRGFKELSEDVKELKQ
jgi:hypothetical protein